MISSSPKSRENAWLWLYKIMSGLLIFFVLGLHFLVNHLVEKGGLLSYADVVHYYTNPIIPVIEVTFLVLAVSHSLIGIRSIVLDLNPSGKVLQFIDWCFIALGSAAIFYGIALVIIVVSRATGV